MKLEPGSQVRDNLKLLRLIGVGGMGSVWAAQHTGLHAEVAVKFVSAELASSDPALLDRFEREATATAQIKSPHVVQIHDVGVTDEGSPYIVMELLEGQSLGEWLERKRLNLRQAGQVVVQVAKALHRAHQAGIVHRDIKPDNIFLSTSDDGRICKVLDFGIAKQASLPAVSGLTMPGMLIGTPEYMSPEGIDEPDNVDGQLDLWALAVVAYLSVTGELPFWAEGIGKLCGLICTTEPALASSHRKSVPAELDAWFTRAFDKDKSKRFQSAKEMATAFVRALPSHRDDDVFASGAFTNAPEAGDQHSEVDIPPPPNVPTPTLRGPAADGGTGHEGETDPHTTTTPTAPTSSPPPPRTAGGWDRFSSGAPESDDPPESLSAPDSFDGLDEDDRVTWDASNWDHVSSAMLESTSGLKVDGAPPNTALPGLAPTPRITPSGSVRPLIETPSIPPSRAGRSAVIVALVASVASLGLTAALFFSRGAPEKSRDDSAAPAGGEQGAGTELGAHARNVAGAIASGAVSNVDSAPASSASAAPQPSAEPVASQAASSQPPTTTSPPGPAWPRPAGSNTTHRAPPRKPAGRPAAPPKKNEDFGF